MSLLKIFIPSWRFFDRAGDKVVLCYRSVPGSHQWLPLLTPQERRWWNLWLNPQGNLYLASTALVERLAQEISEDSEERMSAEFIEHQTSFKLVKSLMETRLRQDQTFTRYQFMIQIQPANGDAAYELLTSEEYSL